MRSGLVITDVLFNREAAEVAAAPLHKAGWTVEYRDWGYTEQSDQQTDMLMIEQHGPDEADSAPAYAFSSEASVLVVGFAPIPAAMLDQLPNLELIAINRAGTENISEHAETRGIRVANTRGRNARAVAEYTIGFMLSETRNIARGHQSLKEGVWRVGYPNDDHVSELGASVVGLVGFGQVGRLVAQALQGFGSEILVYDPYTTDLPDGCESVDLEQLLRRADIVSLHARLGPETEHLIDSPQLDLMKSTAVIVNTARAELVNEDALAHALAEGGIAGAALDVFRVEPPDVQHGLVSSPRTTITPHLAGTTRDAFLNGPKMVAATVESYLEERQAGDRIVDS